MTARRTSLSSLVFGMFNHANNLGTGDVEKLIQENPEARALAFEHIVKSRPFGSRSQESGLRDELTRSALLTVFF